MSTAHSTRSSLIERIQQQNSQAWSEFVELYAPMIFAWLQSWRFTLPDAADVTQETLLAVYRNVDSYRPSKESGFRGWLWTIALNKARDHIRRNPMQGRGAGGTDQLDRLQQLADDDSTDMHADRPMAAVFRRAIDQVRPDFDDRTWQMFWRCVVDGQSTGAVADALQTSPSNVRQARCRVLRRLREQLSMPGFQEP